MPIVCGIKFRGTGKVYYFSPGDQDLEPNDYAVVETSRGKELGRVIMTPRQVDESKIVGKLKPILRLATTLDLLESQRFRRQETDALLTCRERVTEFNLPMKIIGAEYNYDGTRLTFFFTSEQRVDFRELVRELAHIFKTRIELRQIGVRDEARMLGGLGKCGRSLCCSTWLTEFCPVSIRMAKQQDLPLSPMEISGLCGRLLCCLVYENDYYRKIKSKFPKVGKMVDTPYGPGKVIRVSVLRETISVLLEDSSTLELTAEELAAERPVEPGDKPSLPGGIKRKDLDAALQTTTSSNALGKEKRKGGADNDRKPSGRSSRSKRSRRSRSRRKKTGEEQTGKARQDAKRDSRRPKGGPSSRRRPRRRGKES